MFLEEPFKGLEGISMSPSLMPVDADNLTMGLYTASTTKLHVKIPCVDNLLSVHSTFERHAVIENTVATY